MRETKCPHCGVWFVNGTKHACRRPPSHTDDPIVSNSAMKCSFEARQVPLAVLDVGLTKIGTNRLADGLPPIVREAWDLLAVNIRDHQVSGSEANRFFSKVLGPAPSRTLADLYGMTRSGFYALVDEGWDSLVIEVEPDRQVWRTIEPPHRLLPRSFPTSDLVGEALARFGIVFRCDGRPPASVRQDGFTPLYRFNPPLGVRHTMMERGMRLFRANQDVVGETAVCVSRRLSGCTKFPKPDASGRFHIYAICPQGLALDTEKWQAERGRAWLPGEKALSRIDGSEVIAHVEVDKLGAGEQGVYYRYSFAGDAQWEFYGADESQRTYLTNELLRLRGAVREVLEVDDFDRGLNAPPPPPPPRVGRLPAGRLQGLDALLGKRDTH